MESFRYWGDKKIKSQKTPQNVKKQGRSWFKLGGDLGRWGCPKNILLFFYFLI
jgi:hypothetical protein